jgi:glycosyltransferase involved in cell wall biosynthesis
MSVYPSRDQARSGSESRGAASSPLFTVFTPTFNRAETLPRAYESLKAQTRPDFEWLVIDDGSTDGTAKLVDQFIAEDAVPIRYVRQENAGKHVCTNLATHFARGRYLATLDSDDWYVETALQTFADVWESIAADEYDGFSGVVGLCATARGEIIGDSFPADVFDTTWFDAFNRHRIKGDKAGCGRVEVDRTFPFPVIEGETLVMEAIVYRRMSRNFRLRCVNKVIKVVEYRADGLSATMRERLVENPRTARLFYLEALQDRHLLPRSDVVRASANAVRFSMHAGFGLRSVVKDLFRPYRTVGLGLGTSLFVRDRLRRRVRAAAARRN